MIVDLPAYCARIRYTGSTREPTLALLRELQICHVSAIAFECLDPFLGVPVEIDTASIQQKLVHAHRGGYCHEHNALFHDVLAALGYSVTALGARVMLTNTGEPGPEVLTHRLTLVSLPEGQFIADVGFGGQSPTTPISLGSGLEHTTAFGAYRVTQGDEAFRLEMKLGGDWKPLYRFNLAPQTQADFEVANWYTSTHPRSRFTQNLIVCRVVGETRANLLNTTLALRRTDGVVEHHTLDSANALEDVLSGTMGLTLPVPIESIWARLGNA